MTDTQNFRPVSLAKVREWAKERFGSCIYPSCEEHLPFRDVLAICDIAEAAQAVAHEAEFYADDDTPDDSLIVVPRADMKKLDEALVKVTP